MSGPMRRFRALGAESVAEAREARRRLAGWAARPSRGAVAVPGAGGVKRSSAPGGRRGGGGRGGRAERLLEGRGRGEGGGGAGGGGDHNGCQRGAQRPSDGAEPCSDL